MTSFKPFKKENELRLVLMLFLVFERNSEVPWFESKCDIGNNSDQKFRERIIIGREDVSILKLV